MKKIFIGMLLIFIDFNLNINQIKIGLVPDFIGYIVMFKGLEEMNCYGTQFRKARPFAIGMAVYTGVLYAMDFIGISNMLGYFSMPLGIASVAVSLYISYLIVAGIRDIEKDRCVNLNGEKLFSTWKLLAIFQVITYLLLFVPVPVLALASIIMSFVFSIIFLVALNTAKKLFYVMPPSSDGEATEPESDSL